MTVKGKEGVKERKRYIACAKDLNEALGLKPKINVRDKNLELIAAIILNADCPDNPEDAVALSDALEDDTWAVLKELKCGPHVKKAGELDKSGDDDDDDDDGAAPPAKNNAQSIIDPPAEKSGKGEGKAAEKAATPKAPKKDTLMAVFAAVMKGADPMTTKEICVAVMNNGTFTEKTVGVYVSIFLRTLVQFGVMVKEVGKYSMKK